MSKPRIHVLALGGTIATQPDASGVMHMGAGADDLVKAVPLLGTLADTEAIRFPSTRSTRSPRRSPPWRPTA